MTASVTPGSLSASQGGIDDLFAEVARLHPRCIWLDGGGGRAWSGHRSVLGWLEPSDVSLTYSAARREVLRHADGRAEVVGDDIWTVLEREVATGGQWFGYLGYACRPDLPATPSADLPDAVWMRPSRLRMVDHPRTGRGGSGRATAPCWAGWSRPTSRSPTPPRVVR